MQNQQTKGGVAFMQSQKEQLKGLIFDIQGYSVHDGPGCRTLIFLSGCPLRCDWCANPEGQELKQQVMYQAQKCKYYAHNCRRCIYACPCFAIIESDDPERPVKLDREKCQKCTTYECTKACIHESLVLSGKWMTVDELMAIIDRDRRFWGKDGGVTFGGGEPFMQKEFLFAVLKKCKEAYIHTAIETSAYVDTQSFLKAFDYLNFAFVDIKHMDTEKHREVTGVGNELILKNVEALANSDWPGTLVIRIPIIEGFNNSYENIIATAEFLKKVGLDIVNILPFHRLGDSKYTQLGKSYKYSDCESPPREVLERIQQIFHSYNIGCFIGSDTPF